MNYTEDRLRQARQEGSAVTLTGRRATADSLKMVATIRRRPDRSKNVR